MRYDLKSPRPKKDDGTHWHTVGSMWANNNGGFTIILDSLPLPDSEGKVRVVAFEPRDGGQRQQRQEPQGGYGGGTYGSGPIQDDEVPFAPEVR